MRQLTGLFLGLFIIILLASSQDYNLNSSNLSQKSPLFSGISKLQRADAAISGKNWTAEAVINLPDNLSRQARAGGSQIVQLANPDSIREDMSPNLSINFSIGMPGKADSPIDINQSVLSRRQVHEGESIQAAIDAAAGGDILEVASGTYHERVRINKPLTIRGIDNGRGAPLIDADGRGNAVDISADQVIFEDIAVSNSSNSSQKAGAGIRLSSSSNCTISGIVSHNNYYGIHLVDSDNNSIIGSNVSKSQCGIRIYFSDNNTLEHNTINDTGKPIDIVSSQGNLIQGNIFVNNSHEIKSDEQDKNKITNNYEIFKKYGNESLESVQLNARPRSEPSGSSGSKHSSRTSGNEDYDDEDVDDVDGIDGIESDFIAAPVNRGERYNELAKKAAGTLVFNPPKAMTIGIEEWIDARIGQENSTRLIQGLLGKGDVQFRDISIATNMTYVVKLEGDSGFNIVAKRPDAQILGFDPAVWMWQVTPMQSGNHTLILSVDLQLEKPPFNCRCVNVSYWPVSVKVLEPSLEQQAMDIAHMSYSMIAGSIAFLASLISLILLIRKLKKGKDED